MTAAAPFFPKPTELSLQHVLVPRQSAPLWEQAIVSLWLLVTFIPFPNDELILYPLVALFVVGAALRYDQIVPVALRVWPILLVPALATFSMLWAPIRPQALRFGIMMFLTALIAIYIASRMTPREIVRAAFFACAVSAIVAFLQLDKVGQVDGIYPQKNIFSLRMQLIMVVCICVALDRDQHLILRLIAIPFVPLVAALVLGAGSATGLLLAGGSIIFMTAVWLVWTNAVKVRHFRLLTLLVSIAVTVSGVLVFLNLPNNTVINDGLFALGKDTTLTNRTVLWADAARISEQQPWLGVGATGFWTPSNGQAESILDYSYKSPGTVFSFHSVYYEVLVHLGYVGLVLMIFQIFWIVQMAFRHWLRVSGMSQALLLLLTLIAFVISFTESTLFSVIEISIVLFLIAGVSPVAERIKFTKVLAPPPPPMPDFVPIRP
ncbi:MAG: O-antigen ligase family protein [Pseudomonadota bacterium]